LSARAFWRVKSVTRVQVMLNSAAIARPLRVSEMYRDDPCDDVGPKLMQLTDSVRDQNSPLNRYIEGWAQNDLEKILNATAPGISILARGATDRAHRGGRDRNRRTTWKRSSMRPPRAIGSLIRSSEVLMAGRCANISISCGTGSPVQEQSVGASSPFSCKAQRSCSHTRNFNSGARRHGSGSPGWPRSKSENEAS